MNDKELLLILRKNPEEGTQAALEQYGALVKFIVTKVLYFSQEDAEECMADTFLSLWKNRKKLKNHNIKGWLAITARNLAIDRYRKLKRTQNIPIDENIISEEFFEGNLEISELINSLTYPDKEIFLRKYYFLETSSEIAEQMSLTVSDVNTRLSRGRKRMKNQIASLGGVYEN